jgi:RNA polymerase sigma-70 factor (ECF subfamily)
LEEDKELIKRCQRGDLGAYEDLIVLYGKRIFNICYKLLGDYHNASDITQEVYIKIYRNIKKFKFNSSLWTWIYSIVTNSCKDYYRKNNKSINIVSIDEEKEEGNVIEIIDRENYIEDILIKKYEKELIGNTISKLKYEYKEIIVLKDIYGYSYDEISSMVDISMGTVKSRLSRAREKLKKLLENNDERWEA